MKARVVGGIMALLAGFTAFGFYQSFSLLYKNNMLTRSVENLQVELSAAQLSLNKTQALLSESYMKNAQLENDAVYLRNRLSKAQKQLAEEKNRIISLGEYLFEARKTTEGLYARNRQINEQNLRLSFENQEMRKTMSSIAELKKAIARLRKQAGRSKIKKPPVMRKISSKPAPVQKPQPDSKKDGNLGYMIRDGHTTFSDLVNIKVIPAEPLIGAPTGEVR